MSRADCAAILVFVDVMGTHLIIRPSALILCGSPGLSLLPLNDWHNICPCLAIIAVGIVQVILLKLAGDFCTGAARATRGSLEQRCWYAGRYRR